MAAPWEKYQAKPAAPWEKYAAAGAPPPPAAEPPAAGAPLDPYAPNAQGLLAPDLAVPGAPANPMPPAPPADDLVSKIMGGLDYADNTGAIAGDKMREGMANVAGIPVDFTNFALSKLFQYDTPENPVGGSNDIEALLGGYGALPAAPEPQDLVQRIAGRTGQELGSMMLPGMGVINKAGQMGVEAVRQMPQITRNPMSWSPEAIARMFLEPAAVNPGKYAQKEATVAAGAGLGAGLANEGFNGGKSDNALVDGSGALGGAIATGLGGGIGKSVTDIVRAFAGSGGYTDEVVTEAVMRNLASNAGITAKNGDAPDLGPLINQVESGKRVGDTIPGFSDSLADRTKNPGIAALEYGRQSSNPGAYAGKRSDNTAAIDAAMDEVAPTETPGAFRAAADGKRTDLLKEAGDATLGAKTAFDTAVEPLRPLMTGEGRGANIRTALEDASDQAKEVLSAAWKPVREASDAIDMDVLRATFDDVAAPVPRALKGEIPEAASVPGSFVDPEDSSTVMQPISEVMGIRTALTNAKRADGATPSEKRLIDQHVTALDDYLEANVPDSLRSQYEQARAATVDFNDRFTRPQTAIAQTLSEREGLPRGPDSAVAGKFVQSDEGRIGDFEALMKEAGSDERVQSSVRDQILSDVHERGLLEKPDALQKYLDQYGTVFGKFPDLKAQLGDAKNLRGELDTATAGEKALTDTLTKQGKSAVANYLSYADEKADEALSTVFASRDPKGAIDELLTFVGDDPKAVDGARKVFWDRMQSKSRSNGRTTGTLDGAQPWSPKSLNDFLNDPVSSAIAERLYRDKPEHLAHIREISDALQGVDTRNAAKAANTSGTAQSFSQLLTPEALQSRAYAYMSGRVSGTFLVTSIVSVIMRRKMVKAQAEGITRMMDDILLDADLAEQMMKANNPANRQALAKKAKLWFGNEASTILNSLSGHDEDDETTTAAMRTKGLN